MMGIDPVPQTPDFMKGVVNLRGKIIPVIDLRSKFEMEEVETSKETCIVVVDIEGSLTGIIVDSLNGVLTIEEEQFEGSLQFGANIRAEFIIGMAKLEGRVVIILDTRHVLSNDELVLIRRSSAA